MLFKSKISTAFYVLLASLTCSAIAAAPALAVPQPKCQLAKAIGPTADNLSGEVMGLSYRLGIPLAVILFAGLVFFAMTRRAGGLMKAFGTVVGVVIGLGFIVGALVAVTNNPCG